MGPYSVWEALVPRVGILEQDHPCISQGLLERQFLQSEYILKECVKSAYVAVMTTAMLLLRG